MSFASWERRRRRAERMPWSAVWVVVRIQRVLVNREAYRIAIASPNCSVRVAEAELVLVSEFNTPQTPALALEDAEPGLLRVESDAIWSSKNLLARG